MSSDLKALVGKIDKLAAQLDGREMRAITTRVAVAAKRDYENELRGAVGSDMRMSGWRGVKFGSGFELTSDREALLRPRPAGPAIVLEHGRFPRDAPRRARKSSKVLRTPWGPRRGPFRVGATKGKEPFAHAVAVISRETPKRYQQEIRASMASIFKG